MDEAGLSGIDLYTAAGKFRSTAPLPMAEVVILFTFTVTEVASSVQVHPTRSCFVHGRAIVAFLTSV